MSLPTASSSESALAGATHAAAGGLAILDVSHVFGKRLAVDGVSLTVAPGEVVCVLGPSGCGKTTLLRLAAGLERLQSGVIHIGDRTVADRRRSLPPEARSVGMVFQDFALFPHLTVLENVAFGIRGAGGSERRERALAALESVELAGRASDHPHQLSGGEQQRVAIARALAPRPAVMLLDEPFGGLDTRLRQQVREHSIAVLKGSGAAVLLVTHDPEEASALGDRVAVLRAGRVEQIGAPGDLYDRPASAFVARFLGDANLIAGVARDGHISTPFGDLGIDTLRSHATAGGVEESPLLASPRESGSVPVDVFVRPEAVHIQAPGPLLPDSASPDARDSQSSNSEFPRGMRATVTRVRRLGPQCVVDLLPVLDGVDESQAFPERGEVPPLRSLSLGSTALRPGDTVRFTLDPSGASAFESGEPTGESSPGVR